MNHIKDYQHYIDEDTCMTMVEVTTQCPLTGQQNKINILGTDWDRWQEGEYIQTVFSHLTPDEREMLMTGTSPDGWGKIFG